MEMLRSILTKLELTRNETKTKIVDDRKERFSFLGFMIGVRKKAVCGKTAFTV
jgi:hypothetical protein